MIKKKKREERSFTSCDQWNYRNIGAKQKEMESLLTQRVANDHICHIVEPLTFATYRPYYFVRSWDCVTLPEI